MLFFIFTLTTQITKAFDCYWAHSSNISFNLCSLKLGNDSQLSYYEVYDKRSTSNVSYWEYDFNVCDNIMEDPSLLTDPLDVCTNNTLRIANKLPYGYCDNVFNYSCIGNIIPINITTAAYQLQNSDTDFQTCYRLHDGKTAPTWSFYESDNPASGVVLTYSNGDWCYDAWKKRGRNREFRLAFICDNFYSNVFDKEEQIEETELCIYQTNIKSIWGCPEQCKVVNEQMCNNNGVCGYDYTNKYPRCFCYAGYYGEDCTSTEDDSISTEYKDNSTKYVALLIVIVILLIVVLATFFYLLFYYTNIKYMAPKRKSLIPGADPSDDNDIDNNNNNNNDENNIA